MPGAFEIPLHAKRLARSGRYAAIVGCALVVDGGIYRHEFVASTVVEPLMSLQLETDVPVLSAVLTPHHFHEHVEHRKYFHRHFAVKGTEVAEACMRTLQGLERLQGVLSNSSCVTKARPQAAAVTSGFAPHAAHIERAGDQHALHHRQPDDHARVLAVVHQPAEDQRRHRLPDVQARIDHAVDAARRIAPASSA